LPQIATAPYEAHQKARTFASRYVKSNQYDTAIDVLFQSSRELLKNGQTGSGVDLAGFLLEVYDAKSESVTDESRKRITQLIALTGSGGTWRKMLVDKAFVWSVKLGKCPAGDRDLHHYVGELLYKEGAFDLAEPHLLASGTRDSARLLAEMFIKWLAVGGTPGDFAIRGVIPNLQNGNILAARTFISHYTSALPKGTGSRHITVGSEDEVFLTKDPIVNFAQIAVLTCQRAQGDRNKVMRESWVRLCGTYQSRGGVLATPEVRSALNELANLYFAIPLPRSQAANPFGDVLSSLFGSNPTSQQPRRLLSPGSDSPELD